ncbi:MAG: hypothetical protein ACRDYY_11965 [Acidimicrobiales bacterium]
MCGVLGLERRRVWRWQARAAAGALADRPPGGNPVHGLLAWEEEAIVELFNDWGPVDRFQPRTVARSQRRLRSFKLNLIHADLRGGGGD